MAEVPPRVPPAAPTHCRILRGTESTAVPACHPSRVTLSSLVTVNASFPVCAERHLHSTRAHQRDRRKKSRIEQRLAGCSRRDVELVEVVVATWKNGPQPCNAKLIWAL